MPIISGGGGSFNGGTVPNATTFQRAVTFAAQEPSVAFSDHFAHIIPSQNLTILDAAADFGTGNGIAWLFNGADGNQAMHVTVGSTGQFVVAITANGVVDTSGAAGIQFPTADPHLVGVWWDNAGVLTRSAG